MGVVRPRNKGPAPVQKGVTAEALKGRKLISEQRYVGCINEWHTSWGWIEPLDVVVHPQSRKNRGRIYVNRADARGYVKMELGTKLDFCIYCDARGLGAVDCTEIQKSVVAAAAAVAASDGDVMPEGWEKHWSAEHNEYFYWNRITKETSWVPPKPIQDESEENELPLPAGWTKQYDEENHQWFYWDKQAKRASWDRPTAPAAGAVKSDIEPPAKKAKLGEDAVGADTPVLALQKVKGTIVEWHGIFGWIVPSQELAPDLRPLLEKGDGKVYVNWRDVQPGVEAKVDLDVEFMLYEDDNGLAASDVGLLGGDTTAGTSSAVAKNLANRWAEEDAADAGDAAEAAAAEEEEGEHAKEGPLLPGWEQHWSDEHQCNYYWHTATKVAAWERPCLPFGDDDEEQEEEKVWEGEGAEEGAYQMATPFTPLVSQAGRAMTPETPVTMQGKVAAHPSKPSQNPQGVPAKKIQPGLQPWKPANAAW